MLDTRSVSGETSEGKAYSMRSRGEPEADESRMTAPLAAILNELYLMKKEMAANKAEFDQNLVDLRRKSARLQKATQHQPLDRISRRHSRPLCSLQMSQWLA
jgi:hypothetical protein